MIIDEATQALEPTCMIPITNGGKNWEGLEKVILIGDSKQLQAFTEV